MDKEKPIEEILTLNENDPNDLKICYDYLKNYLDNIKNKEEWAIEDVTELNVLIGKFIQFANPIKSDIKDLIKNLRKESNYFEKNIYKREYNLISATQFEIDSAFHSIYSSFLEIYKKIDQYYRHQKEDLLDFDGLINYDLSNKKGAQNIIQEAIKLIEDDNTLSKKSKEKIIKYLNDAIQELNKPQTKWKNFFIKIGQVIFVLSALGGIVGGVNAGSNLLEARDKVENANKEIVNTSINVNHMNIENTFKQKKIEMNNNQILMIERNNK
jgi:hypothetical protein